MECWLKSSREEQGWGQQAAETDNNQVPALPLAISIISSHVQPPCLNLLSRPRLSGVRGRGLDPLWPPGECSLGLGYNLGIYSAGGPVSGSIMPHYPRVLSAHRAQPRADASTLHFTYTFAILQSIPPTDKRQRVSADFLHPDLHYSFKYILNCPEPKMIIS